MDPETFGHSHADGLSHHVHVTVGNFQDHCAACRIPAQALRVEVAVFEAALSQVGTSALREILFTVPDVGWGDVGGLDATKKRLQQEPEHEGVQGNG
jgi:hypothetical protein